jgi:hypothetical protein
MADMDPTLPKSPIEGPYSVAKRERLLDTILPPIAPPSDSQELPRLIQIRRQLLAELIEDALGDLDTIDGDPDLETTDAEDELGECQAYDGPGCAIADPDSAAWIEWTTMRGAAKTGPNFMIGHEDAEEDDCDDAQSEDEPGFEHAHRRWANRSGDGAGCKISDDDAVDEREPGSDDEIEQMVHDVPCLKVFALEPNPFDGKRKFLGMSNLKPSFRSNGQPMVSAD